MGLQVGGHSPIPIRRQLREQLKHVIEDGGVPRNQALPSIRELAGFLGTNPNTVARVIEDLKQSGYVEARRGKGVFVAPAPPARPSPNLRAIEMLAAILVRQNGDRPVAAPRVGQRRLSLRSFRGGRRHGAARRATTKGK